ncbi:MAG TPA: hypothetical protein VMU11_02510 [Verrucomicrobiae bacterium]|nr:hypothetical protein [Verrucomicrobiae bacterium]
MTKMTLFPGLAALVILFGASTASAQGHACAGDTRDEHVHTVCAATETPVCSAVENCLCDTGYHQEGSLSNGDPRCVRDTITPDVCDPELLGTESDGGHGCRCTAENRAAGAIGTVPVAITQADRRAHGLPLHGYARGCYVRGAHGEVLPAPFSDWEQWRHDVDDYLAYLDGALRDHCGATPEMSREEVRTACRDAHHALAEAHAAPDAPDMAERLTAIDNQLVAIEDELNALRDRVSALETHDQDHERRITALEHRPGSVADGPNSFALSLGVMGELGFATYGPMTLSGDAMVTGMFRPGDARADVYLRLRGGGAFTGWSTGSAHIAASAGVSFYLDDHLRRGLTLAVGAWAEDLLDLGPDGPGQVRGDTIGFAAGGELNLAIPVASFAHIEVGAALGYSERYAVGSNGRDLLVMPGFYVAPHVGVTFQLF